MDLIGRQVGAGAGTPSSSDGEAEGRLTLFCSRHRSHFCPCIAPRLYEGEPEKAAAWEDAELAAQLWDRPKRERT